MCVVESDFILVQWIGIDLVIVQRSKMTCFSLPIENNWVFVWRHRTRLGIRVGIRLELISVMGSK